MLERSDRTRAARVAAALAAGILACAALLAVCLYLSLSLPSEFDASGWPEAEDSVVWTVETKCENGRLYVTGYAVEAGLRMYEVNTRILLYDAGTGRYLELPTQMSVREDAAALPGMGADAAFGGFCASAPVLFPGSAAQDSEVCIAWDAGGQRGLIRTGRKAGDAA